MRIQTFSVIVGGTSCNAHCPFCVSRMTGPIGQTDQTDERSSEILKSINWQNFQIACNLAQSAGATTVMLTGKGEPTLWPAVITQYLYRLNGRRHPIPIIELQTNGLAIPRLGDGGVNYLKQWRDYGLTTVAVSVAHYDGNRNREIYLGNNGNVQYPSLSNLVDRLHDFGFSVRLCCVGIKGYIDSFTQLAAMADWARNHKVEQLTFTPINCPTASKDLEALEWTKQNRLFEGTIDNMRESLDKQGDRLLELVHGAIVYDLAGQNVCLNNCLDKRPTDPTRLRNLIFHPNGRLRYRWDKRGAIIL